MPAPRVDCELTERAVLAKKPHRAGDLGFFLPKLYGNVVRELARVVITLDDYPPLVMMS